MRGYLFSDISFVNGIRNHCAFEKIYLTNTNDKYEYQIQMKVWTIRNDKTGRKKTADKIDEMRGLE